MRMARGEEGSRGTTPSWDADRHGGVGGVHRGGQGGADDAMQCLPPLRLRRRELREVKLTCKHGGAFGGPYALGHSLDQQLLPTSQTLLRGLQRWPEDDDLRAGFDQVVGSIKLTEAPMRYYSWPWEPLPEPPPLVSQKGVAPGKLEPPSLASATFDTLTLQWSGNVQEGCEVDPAGDFELSEFVILSPQSGVVARYELEMAEIDAIFGAKPWRAVHRGPAAPDGPTSFRLGGIGRGTSKVRARICATNRFGRGPWSEKVDFDVPEIPEEEPVEVEEIPAAWISLDIGGLEAFDERNEPSMLLRAKEDLLRALHTNRNVIKVAFTFYGLAGVNDVNDDPSTMSMIQFTNFCTGARLLESEGLNKLSDLDLVFVRASRVLPGDAEQALAEAVDSSGVAVSAGWRKKKGLDLLRLGIQKVIQQKGAPALTQVQFVGALLRLASQMYVGDEPIHTKLTKLCEQHIAGHVYDELQLVKDAFNSSMRTRQMGSVLDYHAKPMREIFRAYAAADTEGDGTAAGKKEAKAALETMNVREVNELCEDIEIFDQTFTTMKLLAIFCKVNIDDDLFEQVRAHAILMLSVPLPRALSCPLVSFLPLLPSRLPPATHTPSTPFH